MLCLRCRVQAFLVAVSGGYSLLWCTGFLLWWLLLLRSTGSRCMGFSSCGSWALERRLSSCGTWAYLLHSMWDLPGPGLKPVSPALAGGFLATVPPGKSLSVFHFEYLAFLLLPDFLPQITITWVNRSDAQTQLAECLRLGTDLAFFSFLNIYLFIWLHWVFVVACGIF